MTANGLAAVGRKADLGGSWIFSASRWSSPFYIFAIITFNLDRASPPKDGSRGALSILEDHMHLGEIQN